MQPLTSSADVDLEAGLEMSAIEHQDNKVLKGIVEFFLYFFTTNNNYTAYY